MGFVWTALRIAARRWGAAFTGQSPSTAQTMSSRRDYNIYKGMGMFFFKVPDITEIISKGKLASQGKALA